MRRGAGQKGASLVAVVVIMGLAAAIATVVFRRVSLGMAAQAWEQRRLDAELLRGTIARTIDCEATFAAAGIADRLDAGACDSTSAPGGQDGPYFPLRRRSLDGTAQWLTGPTLDATGAAPHGGWSVRASCSASERSLVVRAAILDEAGGVQRDGLTGKALEFLLFGSEPGVPSLCYGEGPPCESAIDPSWRAISVGATRTKACSPGYTGRSCIVELQDANGPPAWSYIGGVRGRWNTSRSQCSVTSVDGGISTVRMSITCCKAN